MKGLHHVYVITGLLSCQNVLFAVVHNSVNHVKKTSKGSDHVFPVTTVTSSRSQTKHGGHMVWIDVYILLLN